MNSQGVAGVNQPTSRTSFASPRAVRHSRTRARMCSCDSFTSCAGAGTRRWTQRAAKERSGRGGRGASGSGTEESAWRRRDQRRRRERRRVCSAYVRNSVGGMCLFILLVNPGGGKERREEKRREEKRREEKRREEDGVEYTLVGFLKVSTSVIYTNTIVGWVSGLDCCSC